MRLSTIVLLLGAVVFAIPVPGTFILGGLILALGGIARWLDF
ncbi:transporter [Halorussus halophilus]|nr:transporter [Halorussus halophilus]